MPRYRINFQCEVEVCAEDEDSAYDYMWDVIGTDIEYFIKEPSYNIKVIECEECCKDSCDLEEE